MKKVSFPPRLILAPLLVVLLLAAAHPGTARAQRPASAEPPTIDRIDPPDWWVGLKWSPLQLMVYGSALSGPVASFDEPSLRVVSTHSVPNTNYLFVDVAIPADLMPGTYVLTLQTAGGTVTYPYALRRRNDDPRRHRGFDSADVVYLVTPDRFANGDLSNDRAPGVLDDFDPSEHGMRHGGDLRGLTEHLDYLADLGVTALWLNPVLENRGRNSYHGYAATDLYRIDPRFGTNSDYRTLVREAHSRGLKVIFDHVNNHIGVRHPWVSNRPTDTWLNGTVKDHLSRSHYKHAITDPYRDADSERRLRDFWFVDAMPDLNQRDPFLATYLIQNSIWWIEYSGLDGIREDTYPYPDQPFLARWARALLEEYPDFNIVGEIWEPVPAYLAMFQAGSRLPGAVTTNLPSVMDFALTEALRDYLRGDGPLVAAYTVLAQDFLYADPARLMTFADNHDMTRIMYLAGGDARRAKQVLGLLLTSRGIPQLLYGTEIGMVGGASHVELRADFPGGFPNDNRSAFESDGRTASEREIFDFTRRLLHLRKTVPALHGGQLVQYPADFGVDIYRYLRFDSDRMFLVILNGHNESRTVSLSELAHRLPTGGRFANMVDDALFDIDPVNGLPIEPRGFLLLEVLAPNP